MSTINNVPFDINRTPVERNATVKRRGTVPVYHTIAIKPLSPNDSDTERRKGNRRKMISKIIKNNRFLTERRQNTSKPSIKEEQLANAHNHGHIIDLEV